MRANHGLLVVQEIVRLRRSLLRENLEVIQPEVGHHFLELAVASDSACNSRRLELADDGATTHRRILLHRAVRAHALPANRIAGLACKAPLALILVEFPQEI